MNQPPFELEPSDYEVMRATDKDGTTIFVLDQQLFNWSIKRYTHPYSWNTQW